MKSLLVALVCFVAISTLTSFSVAKKQLIGTWAWVFVINPTNGAPISVQDLTMGMASSIKTELAADGSYKERKVRASNNTVSTTTGEWKLEQDGTSLSMKKVDGDWIPSKIISFKQDTLVLEMMAPLQLTMVREKDKAQ